MSNYDLAWLLVVLFGVLGAFGLYRLFLGWSLLFKVPLVATVFAIFVLPAPVPRFEGEFAPAIIVYVFELLFQIDGQPDTAGAILLIGGVSALVVGVVVATLLNRRLRRRRAQAVEKGAVGNEAAGKEVGEREAMEQEAMEQEGLEQTLSDQEPTVHPTQKKTKGVAVNST